MRFPIKISVLFQKFCFFFEKFEFFLRCCQPPGSGQIKIRIQGISKFFFSGFSTVLWVPFLTTFLRCCPPPRAFYSNNRILGFLPKKSPLFLKFLRCCRPPRAFFTPVFRLIFFYRKRASFFPFLLFPIFTRQFVKDPKKEGHRVLRPL